MDQLTPAQLAFQFDELVRSMPDKRTLHHDSDENQQWLARASALMHLADPIRAVFFDTLVSGLFRVGGMPSDNIKMIVVKVQQFRTEFSLKAGGPLTAVFDAKQPFDYYDEVRRVVALASEDIFFADPYMNGDFISRYMPHVKPGVRVRLLGRESIRELRSAAALFAEQSDLAIEVRVPANKHHDRYIFVDRRQCWQSGASFKDGGRTAPTTFTELVDAFSAVSELYEQKWSRAT